MMTLGSQAWQQNPQPEFSGLKYIMFGFCFGFSENYSGSHFQQFNLLRRNILSFYRASFPLGTLFKQKPDAYCHPVVMGISPVLGSRIPGIDPLV